MGIDVSGLDVVITAGWPGTRASLWQQFGRAGRADAPALGIFVARDDPLDSYLVHHPEVVIERDVEASVFDPGNRYVLAPHLCAAAAEVPLTDADLDAWFGPTARSVIDELSSPSACCAAGPAGWFWTRRERASDLTDLRGSGGAPVRVVEDGTGRLLGTVDRASAAATVHRGAVYVHQGVTHVVVGLDLDDAVATVVEQDVDYSTLARSVSDIRIVEVAGVPGRRAAASWRRRRQLAGGLVPAASTERRVPRRGAARPARPGAAHAGRVVDAPPGRSSRRPASRHPTSPVPRMPRSMRRSGCCRCSPPATDGISAACRQPCIRTPDQPTVFVYDGYPGGAGFAEHGFRVAGDWLTATREAIASCGCEAGCPSCVQSPKCGNGNNPLDKDRAVLLLDLVLTRLAGRPA